jgi:hypothetical protein
MAKTVSQSIFMKISFTLLSSKGIRVETLYEFKGFAYSTTKLKIV